MIESNPIRLPSLRNFSTSCTLFGLCIALICSFSVPWVSAQETVPVIGRFLLVSAEGLYVVEADRSSSWSYKSAPYEHDGSTKYDDLLYDGWALPNGHFLFSAHKFAREIDREKRTVWEYRVGGTAEVKTCVPLPDGNVAVINSQEQAILELESGTGRILHRIAVPAKGTDHTRYNLVRRTPNGTYLVALRAEERIVEVDRDGKVLLSIPCPATVAQRLADGSTMVSGIGLTKFDQTGKEIWSFRPADAAPAFQMLIGGGFVELPDNRILAVNSDWHYKAPGDNRVQLYIVGTDKKVSWTFSSENFDGWKRGEVEPRTKLIEHRCMMIQLIN